MMAQTEFETRVADALHGQFGPTWWLHGAHPQTLHAYAAATTEEGRQRARDTMVRDAIAYAVGCMQAGIAAGIVREGT